jgi:hypothetical protein
MNCDPGEPFLVMVDRPGQTLLSVVKGCYVTLDAKGLFRNSAAVIDGLLLDATFKII